MQYYGDPLVPPELCRLLYLTVPDELHVPVAFHNRPTPLVSRGALASCHGDQIHVNLNKVYDAALRERKNPRAPTVSVWRTLLGTCYHEFGHVATQAEFEAVGDAYMSYRGHMYIEGLADDWRDQRIAMLLEHEGRLAQPRALTGYLGLRVARLMDSWRECQTGREQGVRVTGAVTASFVSEVRCRRTGGQLSTGDALLSLGISAGEYPNAYDVLRRASLGIGIAYVDGAGRNHKLYTWGDLSLLQHRLDRQRLRRVPGEARTYRMGIYSDLDGHKEELLVCLICTRRGLPEPALWGCLRLRRHLTEMEVERFGPLLRAHSREHMDRGESEY